MCINRLTIHSNLLSTIQLEAIEPRVAYPNKTFDDNYLEMLYGEVYIVIRIEILMFQ